MFISYVFWKSFFWTGSVGVCRDHEVRVETGNTVPPKGVELRGCVVCKGGLAKNSSFRWSRHLKWHCVELDGALSQNPMHIFC